MVGGGVGGSTPNDIASQGKWVAAFFLLQEGQNL